MKDAEYANCTFFKIFTFFVSYMVFRDFGVANHESDVRFRNSEWLTQNVRCKERKFLIY